LLDAVDRAVCQADVGVWLLKTVGVLGEDQQGGKGVKKAADFASLD
jgi:hypothetical protein